MQAVGHKWPESYAAALFARMAVNHTDDVTLTEEVLLEPSAVSLLVERGPTNSSSADNAAAAGDGPLAVGADSLPLSVSEKHLSLPRLPPAGSGVRVLIR